MTQIPLYKYTRPNGGTTVSPIKPDGEYTQMVRLIADEGMELMKGDNRATCADADSAEGWTEVPAEEVSKNE